MQVADTRYEERLIVFERKAQWLALNQINLFLKKINTIVHDIDLNSLCKKRAYNKKLALYVDWFCGSLI